MVSKYCEDGEALLNNKGCVTLWPCHLHSRGSEGKRRISETQIFHQAKIYQKIFKKCSKRNQNPSRYYNSITNLKFQTQAEISSFKNPHIKTDLLLLSRGQAKPLKLLHSIMNLNTISLPEANKVVMKLLASGGCYLLGLLSW